GILKNWKYQLDQDSSVEVSLVSPLAFTFLEDLTARARNISENTTDLLLALTHGSSAKFNHFFDNFCKSMSIDKTDGKELKKCISYLRRINYRQTPDTDLKDHILDKIRLLIVGNEEEIYDTLISWIVDGQMLGKKIDFI